VGCWKALSHRNNGSKCVVLGYNSTYFSNKIQKGKTCYSEEQVISMLEFLIDYIFVSFGGTLFQQVVSIPMGTNGAPLLDDLFVYSYESEFLQKLVKDKKIHEASMTFHEIRIIATGHCIPNQLRDVNTIYRRSCYITALIWKIYDFKIEVVPFIINFSTELTSGGYINGRKSANLELLIDKTSSIYLYVKLKALAS
jgi:hypothetical protein